MTLGERHRIEEMKEVDKTEKDEDAGGVIER